LVLVKVLGMALETERVMVQEMESVLVLVRHSRWTPER
jgi:hypothetical protein